MRTEFSSGVPGHRHQTRRWIPPHGFVFGAQGCHQTAAARTDFVRHEAIFESSHAELSCGQPRALTANGNQIMVELPDIEVFARHLGRTTRRRPADLRITPGSIVFRAFRSLLVTAVDGGNSGNGE